MKYIYTALFLDTTQKSLIFLDASLLAIVFLMQLTKLPMQ